MSDTSSEFESFLAAVESSGKLDSTADFTINTLKARQKISVSQLPRAGLWLVKLVQAAVSCGAKNVKVQFKRREVCFRFDLDDWPWEPLRIFQDFLSGVLPSEPVFFHLFAGLRSSLFEDTVSAKWTIATRETVFTANFHADGTDITEEPGNGRAGFRLVTSRPPRWPGFKKAATTPVRHLIGRTADEFLALHSYCWPSPVSVSLDGRPLENRYVPSASLQDDGFVDQALGTSHLATYKVRPVVLVRRDVPGELSLQVPWEQDEGDSKVVDFSGHSIRLKRRVFFGQTWMDWSLPDDSVPGGCLLLLYGAQMESRIEFICDGAVVDTYVLPWSSGTLSVFGRGVPTNQFKVGLRMLLPVTPAQLDLSHFGVRKKDDLVNAWEPRIREALRQTCEAVLEYAGEFRPELINEPKHPLGKVVGGYFRFMMRIHPVFYFLTRNGFRKEVRTLLDSIPAERVDD